MGNIFSVSCDPLLSLCVDCTKGQALYVWKLEDNLDALKIEVELLTNLKDDIIRRLTVEEADPRMERLRQVQSWLDRSGEKIREVREIIDDESPNKMAKLCIRGYCSKNCKSSFTFGRKVARRLEDIKSLKLEGHDLHQNNQLVQKLPAKPVVEKPTEKIFGLEGMFDRVWSYLFGDQAGIIGLLGMGGIGKTTLLKKVNNKFLPSTHEFDVVIWVTVSQNARLGKVQDDIAERVGLVVDEVWKSKDSSDKAHVLFSALRAKKFLLLLDDIWETISLEDIGVPSPRSQNGSKVVLTTRSDELCREMEVEEVIKFEPLEWGEAWELFKQHVGGSILVDGSNSEITPLAQDIARECDGLPLALKVIARSMAGKTNPIEWQYALQVLRNSAYNLKGMRKVLETLRFSYDNLHDNELRSCFLYCSLFPEDAEIEKENLIDFWVCEDFWNSRTDGGCTQDKGHVIIGNLVRMCLLEEGTGEWVKMHDVIREMAIWIGKEEHNFCVEAGMGLKQPPEIEKWKGVKRMSLMKNDIEKLPVIPNCPNLSSLFLSNNPLIEISDSFFQSMSSLTVLDLSNTRIRELPIGISRIVSLQCLNLSNTEIVELPSELRHLERLLCLNLESTWNLRRIPRQLISSFSLLQVLKMYHCGTGDNLEGENNILVERENLLQEIECLEHLKELTIILRGACDVESFVDAIQRLPNVTQQLSFWSFGGLKELDLLSLGKLKRLQEVEFKSNEDLEEMNVNSIKGELDMKGGVSLYSSTVIKEKCFNNLKLVVVWDCYKLKDLTWLVILSPKLECLEVGYCSEMEEILSMEKVGDVHMDMAAINLNILTKLKTLELSSLPRLKTVYREALLLPSLTNIYVSDCPELKKLPVKADSARGGDVNIYCKREWWNNLEWEDDATKTVFLSCFR